MTSPNNNAKHLKPSVPLWLLKNYVKLIHDKLFYKRTYIIGQENLPANGTPTLVASNHQNCMNDPVAILFSMKRHAKFLTRADVFNNKFANKFLRGIGLLPAYRMDFDGLDAVRNNMSSWQTSESELISGRTIVIFPEGLHQDKHWLGDFTYGYTKLAFEAAQMSDFQTEVFIQPTANHYRSYSHMQSEVAIAFGEPVSIQPYYELFKTKPRTAQREVNKIVRQRVSDLMLNITDLDNYEAIDYLRDSYGNSFARSLGLNPARLDQKLQADKELVAILGKAKDSEPEKVASIYEKALQLKQRTQSLGIRDWLFDYKGSMASAAAEAVAMLALLPLFVISLIPNIAIYALPYLITPKLKDQMFKASIYFGLSILTIPIIYGLWYAAETCITGSALISLIHTALLPIMGLFAWKYKVRFIKLKAKFKYHYNVQLRKIADIAPLREQIWLEMDEIVTKYKTTN